MDQSARLRDDVRELHYGNHELLRRMRHIQVRHCSNSSSCLTHLQINAHSHELEMQSIIEQYHQKLESLELEKVEAITSLSQQHRDEIVALKVSRVHFTIWIVIIFICRVGWHLTFMKYKIPHVWSEIMYWQRKRYISARPP